VELVTVGDDTLPRDFQILTNIAKAQSGETVDEAVGACGEMRSLGGACASHVRSPAVSPSTVEQS
jgi:hypothetical protein